MRHIVICGHSDSAIFFILSYKWHDSLKKIWTKNLCFNFLNIFGSFLVLRRIQPATVIYPLLLSDFNQTWIFSTDFDKTLECHILWKSILWGMSCFMRTSGRTDRQTDMTKLIVACRNFTNAFKYYSGILLEGKREDTKVTIVRSGLRSYIRNSWPRNRSQTF
jgi:hypothetical protein